MMLKWISQIYGFFVDRRNKVFDAGERPSVEFDRPVISVGNLNVGGTGKTPHVEYLVRLLRERYATAVLSRGYGRRTKGYRMAKEGDTAHTLGDEPYQYFNKFGLPGRDPISVAVSEKRVLGAAELIADRDPAVILLDDAFQHRHIKAGLHILLTTFDKPYTRDELIPLGRLREPIKGANRADIIIVTKCPSDITEAQRQRIQKELAPKSHQRLFFSTFAYAAIRPQGEIRIERPEKIIALAGIAEPKPFLNELKQRYEVVSEHLYRDHHRFSKSDVLRLRRDLQQRGDGSTIVVTTEKDWTRLLPLKDMWKDIPLYTLPVKAVIEPKVEFDELILNYVGKSK